MIPALVRGAADRARRVSEGALLVPDSLAGLWEPAHSQVQAVWEQVGPPAHLPLCPLL